MLPDSNPLSRPRHARPRAALLLACLGLLGLPACTGADAGDSAAPEVVDDEPTGLECDTLEIRVTGNDPPAVGDEWTLWLWCDDTLLTGATRLIFDPNDIAAVSENTARFLYAGEASVMVQVGSRRQTRDVTVTEE